MKLKWAHLLALTFTTLLTVRSQAASLMISPTVNSETFLANIRVELPVVRKQFNHLNGNLFPTNRFLWLRSFRQPEPAKQMAAGNIIKAKTTSDSAALFSNVDIGGDPYKKDTEQDLADNDAKNVTYRMPYENLTPYVYGGAAYKFDSKFDNLQPDYSQMGFGAEYRILDNLGIYFDGRYEFRSETQNSKVARAGFRISF